MMVYARVELENYTNKVLNVIKAKYDLKDKSQAINKMADLYGDQIVEKEATENYVRDIDKLYAEHIKKHGYRSMSLGELDALCEI